MTNQKENNYDIFKKVFRKYLPVIVVLAVILSVVIIYKLKGKQPTYLIKNTVKVEEDASLLNRNLKISKVQQSDDFYNKIIAEDKFNEIYGKTQKSNKDEDKRKWLDSVVSVESSDKDDENKLKYTISTLDKDNAKKLSEIYFNTLNSCYKGLQTQYYKTEIELLTKKIEIMKNEINTLGLSKESNISAAYGDALNELANAKVFINTNSDEYIKGDVSEQLVGIGKKKYLEGIAIAVLGSAFVVLFIGFIAEYVKERIKVSHNTRG